MKDLFKIIIVLLTVFLISACGKDSTEEQVKDNNIENNSSRRNNIPLLTENISDKYMGFDIEEQILIEDLKLDDEILNIPFDNEGNFYITDTFKNKIRKYNSKGVLVSDSARTFPDPAVVLFKDNNLYVLDKRQQIIYECNADFNIKGRVLEGKPVVERKGSYVLHVDNKSIMYLLNSDDGILEIFTSSFKKVREIKTELTNNTIFISGNNSRFIYAGDRTKGKIICFDIKDGVEKFRIGEKGSEVILPALFTFAEFDNTLFVVSPTENRVYLFDSENGKYLSSFGTEGTGQSQFVEPVDIYADSSLVFILERKGHRVQVFDTKGNFVRNISTYGREPGKLLFPESIFGIPELGFLFILDSEKKRLQCFDYNGSFVKHYTVLSSDFTKSFGIIADSSNNVFLVSGEGNRVINYSAEKMVDNIPSQKILASNLTVNDQGSVIFINKEKLKIQINEIDGRKLPLNYSISREKAKDIEVIFNYFTLDSKNNIYVLDRYNHRVVKYNKDGKIIQSFGVSRDLDNDGRLDEGNSNGEFKNPYFINSDFNDNLYVGDVGNFRIQKFNSSGNHVKSFGKNGLRDGNFIGKFSFVITLDGTIIVSDYARSYIQLFDMTGNFISAFGKFGDNKNQFINPLGIGKNNQGDIFVLNAKSMDPFKNTDNLILKKMKLIDLFTTGLSFYKKGSFQKAIEYFVEISKHRNDQKTLFYGWYCAKKIGDLENIQYFDKLLKKSTDLSEETKQILKMEGY
ncbi:MAG: NHL repeat-containing protein [Candidatus Muirbacterium halophilum]|nr:NHL repeat-containing protein [Candidatus Muirbacterium halophilum]MCK9477286.1 NHL repeat-containing protein [Candidatus Muirbacterium halophilum]